MIETYLHVIVKMVFIKILVSNVSHVTLYAKPVPTKVFVCLVLMQELHQIVAVHQVLSFKVQTIMEAVNNVILNVKPVKNQVNV